MFYEQVLVKNEVAYAITSREVAGDEVKLKYQFVRKSEQPAQSTWSFLPGERSSSWRTHR